MYAHRYVYICSRYLIPLFGGERKVNLEVTFRCTKLLMAESCAVGYVL